MTAGEWQARGRHEAKPAQMAAGLVSGPRLAPHSEDLASRGPKLAQGPAPSPQGFPQDKSREVG